MSYEWKAIQYKGAGAKPLARSSHTVDVIRGVVYVMGGEHEPRVPIGSAVWCLDIQGGEEGTWRQLATSGQAPPSRNAHASAVVGSCIYIFGGRQGVAMGEGSLNDLYKLDTDASTWTRVSPATAQDTVPEARSYHAMTSISHTLYVFGGCTTAGRLNDLHAFDTLSGKWRSLPSCADVPGRGGAGFAAVGTKLYVVGGFSGKEMNDAHEFDSESSQWRQIKTAASPLPACSVFGIASLGGRKLIVIGGEVDPSDLGHAGAGQFTDRVHVLDVKEEEKGWRRVVPKGEQALTPRGWFSAAAFTDSSVVVFGGNALDNSRLDDAFLLQDVSSAK